MELKTEEMLKIEGGGIASPMINALTKAVTALYDLGKGFGSALRRAISGKYCPVRENML